MRDNEATLCDFSDRVALITGASRGIGRGIAEVLAERGASVVINYLDAPHEAEDVAALIRNQGGRAIVMQADVSDKDNVDRLFSSIGKEFGRLDFLINNAGDCKDQDIFETSVDEWDRILNTNLRSCFLCSKSAMRMMSQRNFGRIVNISSISARRGALFGHAHYAASKSGMLGLTYTLARTGAPRGINVNAIAPGLIETDLAYRANGQEAVEKLRQEIPLGLGRPRDVALATAFLCGEGGRYITGATLDINGGAYMS